MRSVKYIANKVSMIPAIVMILAMLMPTAVSAQWVPDILGDGYTMRHIDQGKDYAGDVRCTVIRKKSPCGGDRGVLYVHGYSDYFFQSALGDRFVDSCYNFYAVDLRRYGRSLLPDQTRFEVRDLKEYFADIDSALSVMKTDGIEHVVLMGHSTGGLIVSYYMALRAPAQVYAVILNSPFFDWNKNGFYRKFLIPAVGGVGKLIPNMSISNGNSTAYSESLLSRYHGEWDYDTVWKPVHPQKVTAGWLRAIDRAQARIQKGNCIAVPVLLMHSDKSIYGDKWTADFQTGDAILNVDHIARYGRTLGPKVTEKVIEGGLHDLILSSKPVRENAYKAIFDFLDSIVP